LVRGPVSDHFYFRLPCPPPGTIRKLSYKPA
jgi:hypothetical protein